MRCFSLRCHRLFLVSVSIFRDLESEPQHAFAWASWISTMGSPRPPCFAGQEALRDTTAGLEDHVTVRAGGAVHGLVGELLLLAPRCRQASGADAVAATVITEPVDALRHAVRTWLDICVEPEILRTVAIDGRPRSAGHTGGRLLPAHPGTGAAVSPAQAIEPLSALTR
jgi:hypothetical protein